MRQNKFILCLLTMMALVATPLSAQTYTAYRIVGKVTVNTPKGDKPIKPGDCLTANANITIPYNGQIQLIDSESSKKVVLKTPGTGKILTLSKDNRNSITELTGQYMKYIIAQISDGGKSTKMEHSDVATVTRELQVTKKPLDQVSDDDEWDLEGEFEAFTEEVNKEYEAFRDQVNQEYAEFMKKGWAAFESTPGTPRPKDEHVAPVVKNRTANETVQTNSFFRKHKKVVALEKPKDQPTPITRIDEQGNEDAPAPATPSVEVNAPKAVDAWTYGTPGTVTAQIWGTNFTVRFDPKDRFKLADTSPNAVSDGWKKLSSKNYNNLIRDCLDLRFEHHLGDWAYLQLLKQVGIACMGEGNEATLLMSFLYCQSGYRMRLCRDGQKLFMLFGSEHYIYDQDYFNIDGMFFYPFECEAGSISICNVPYPDEQSMSLAMYEQQLLDYDPTAVRTIVSERFPNMKLAYSVNQHLIDFYNKYPTSTLNDDFMTRWAMYANTPMDETVKEQLYPELQAQLRGLTPLQAVNRLLNWIQTGYEYRYDEEVWGKDRAFFAEETLYYPYCDCEDRAILLSRLIRDLVGLKCVLVYYPGHLAMATHFDEPVGGTYYTLGNERYYVCDPTIVGWGAPVGECMDQFKDCTDVSLILLDNGQPRQI